LSVAMKPIRAPQENASFGSTRLKVPTPGTVRAVPLTPSLNVKPAVPLSSTRPSSAEARALDKTRAVAAPISLRAIRIPSPYRETLIACPGDPTGCLPLAWLLRLPDSHQPLRPGRMGQRFDDQLALLVERELRRGNRRALARPVGL